ELPVVGQLTTRFQARHLIAFGWLALTCTMYLSTERIDLQISFASATWLRILQYVPLGFIFIPSSAAAYNGIHAEKNNAVAGLVNFMRKYWKQRGNISGHNSTCAPFSASSREINGAYHGPQPQFRERNQRFGAVFYARRNVFGRRAKARAGAILCRTAGASHFPGLHRYLLRARGGGRTDVPAVVPAAKKQSTSRSQSLRALTLPASSIGKKKGREVIASLLSFWRTRRHSNC